MFEFPRSFQHVFNVPPQPQVQGPIKEHVALVSSNLE